MFVEVDLVIGNKQAKLNFNVQNISMQTCNLIDLIKEQYPDYTEIVNIYLLPDCEGCRIGSLGQLAHMNCPDGCLHNPIYCGDCSD